MGSLGLPEILVILVVALIIFGPRKLPELGKTLGESLAQFRKASDDFKRTWESEVELEKRRIDTPTYSPAPEPVSHIETAAATETPPESPAVSPPIGETHPIDPVSEAGDVPPTEAASEHVSAKTAAPPVTETRRDWV